MCLPALQHTTKCDTVQPNHLLRSVSLQARPDTHVLSFEVDFGPRVTT